MNNDKFNSLLDPFEPADVQWRSTGDAILSYVDARIYQDTLDNTFGPAWQLHYKPWGDQSVICELTIHIRMGDTPVSLTRSATGSGQPATAEAQAFRRACAAFGLGRYLYSLDVSPTATPQEIADYINGEYTKAMGTQPQRPATAEAIAKTLGTQDPNQRYIAQQQMAHAQSPTPPPQPMAPEPPAWADVGATVPQAEANPFLDPQAGAQAQAVQTIDPGDVTAWAALGNRSEGTQGLGPKGIEVMRLLRQNDRTSRKAMTAKQWQLVCRKIDEKLKGIAKAKMGPAVVSFILAKPCSEISFPGWKVKDIIDWSIKPDDHHDEVVGLSEVLDHVMKFAK